MTFAYPLNAVGYAESIDTKVEARSAEEALDALIPNQPIARLFGKEKHFAYVGKRDVIDALEPYLDGQSLEAALGRVSAAADLAAEAGTRGLRVFNAPSGTKSEYLLVRINPEQAY